MTQPHPKPHTDTQSTRSPNKQKQLEHAMDLFDRHDRALKQQQRSKASAAASVAATAAAVAAASGVASISGDDESSLEPGRSLSVGADVVVGGGGNESSPSSSVEGPERKRARQG